MKFVYLVIIEIETMKFLESHFDEYIQSCKKYNLHPSLETVFERYPCTHLPNTIFYGPPGTGKYTQSLMLIKKYSPSELKYEKRMLIKYENVPIYIKVSDIHFEVNMAILGCNSKILWNEIYSQIIDVVSTRPHASGVIMCKNFHNIHSELLDVFYSYFRCNNPKIRISFVLLTNHLSFITTNIIQSCETIHMKRPSLTQYKECICACTPTLSAEQVSFINSMTASDLPKISNIKSLKLNRTIDDPNGDLECNSAFRLAYTTTCVRIFNYIINPETIQLLDFRDALYDILICDLDIHNCIWYILVKLFHYLRDNNIPVCNKVITDIMTNTYSFLHTFNNNYRPIYHLECYMFMLINQVYSACSHTTQ